MVWNIPHLNHWEEFPKYHYIPTDT